MMHCTRRFNFAALHAMRRTKAASVFPHSPSSITGNEGDQKWTKQPPSPASANTLNCALELSKKSWLLTIQFPDREQPSLYPIAGGDAEKLMAKLTAAQDRWAKESGARPMITLCYEVGYDAFWLARLLKAGVECLVIDPGSLQVSRLGRRVKTDRVDVKMLLRTLIAWYRGERHVWSVVRIPSIDEEDLRRSHRERSRLVRERTAHINRIRTAVRPRDSRYQRQKPI
jgi:transposase